MVIEGFVNNIWLPLQGMILIGSLIAFCHCNSGHRQKCTATTGKGKKDSVVHFLIPLYGKTEAEINT